MASVRNNRRMVYLNPLAKKDSNWHSEYFWHFQSNFALKNLGDVFILLSLLNFPYGFLYIIDKVIISGNLFLFLLWENELEFNPLSANPLKWPNTLKQFVGKSWRDHFVGLALNYP